VLAEGIIVAVGLTSRETELTSENLHAQKRKDENKHKEQHSDVQKGAG
jgi:hypothetical protein